MYVCVYAWVYVCEKVRVIVCVCVCVHVCMVLEGESEAPNGYYFGMLLGYASRNWQVSSSALLFSGMKPAG